MHRPQWMKQKGMEIPSDPGEVPYLDSIFRSLTEMIAGPESLSTKRHIIPSPLPNATTSQASTISNSVVRDEAERQASNPSLKQKPSKLISDGISLWALAYEDLQQANPDLVKEFENCLGAKTSRQDLDADSLAQRALQEIDKVELSKTRLHATSAMIRKYFEQALKIVVTSKDFITAIASTNPYAALAWTGISFVLPLLLSPTEENEAAIKGLSDIANLMLIYRWKEIRYLRHDNVPASSDFKSQTQPLYTKMLEYEARLVVHRHKASLKRFVSDVFQHGRWTDLIKTIRDLDEKCTKVTDAISVVQARSQVNKTQKWQDKLLQQPRQEKEHENIKRLYSNYQAAKDLNPSRVLGTCQWFLHHISFLTWRETQSSSLLWLSADPGCGKSVLSKYLVDWQQELLTINHEAPTVCYFFFKDTDASRKSSVQAIRAFLHQLLMQEPDLYRFAEKDFSTKNDEFLSDLSSLWTIFLKFTANSSSREIVCVLDALDECDANSRTDLAAKLTERFGGKAQGAGEPILKFIVTSRPEMSIESDLYALTQLSSEIRLRGEEESEQISREINLVIRHKFSEPGLLRRLGERNKSVLLEKLLGMENRTYLWLYLTFNAIEKKLEFKKHDIANIATSIPKKVEDAYTAILDKSEDQVRARKLLHIVLGATQPLTLQEINVAMNIEENCRSYEDLDLWPLEQCEGIVKNICGLFLSVISSKVYLIHQTAKDFLVKHTNDKASTSPQGSAPSKWQHSFDPVQSHLQLTQICIWFLQLQEFSNDHLIFIYRHKLDWDLKLERYEKTNVFAGSKIWEPSDGWHDLRLRRVIIYEPGKADRITISSEADARLGFDDDSRSERGHKLGYDWPEDLIRTFDLCFSLESKERFSTSVKWALEIAEVLAQRYRFLKYAIDSWLLHTTQGGPLLDRPLLAVLTHEVFTGPLHSMRNAYLTSSFKSFRSRGLDASQTVLHMASYFGSTQTVRSLLLEKNADPSPRNRLDETPLMYASFEGHGEIVKLLLANGADEHFADKSGDRVLRLASSEGGEATVSMLLDAGMNTELADEAGRTALHLAILYRRENIVKLLLRRGAVLDSKDSNGKAPLFYAINANIRNDELVETLLRVGAEPNSRDITGESPLLLAAWHSSDKVVKLLLGFGAEVNVMNNNGETPLLRAVQAGAEKKVELLLEHGARMDLSERSKGLVDIAASRGTAAILKMLLDNGLDADVPDVSGQTPFFKAAMYGQIEIVQILLEHGVRIDRKDEQSLSPLSYTVQRGCLPVAKILIDRDVQMDSEDTRGQTPLFYAVGGPFFRNGDRNDVHEIVMLLLAHNVRTDLEDKCGRTPLYYAAAEGIFSVVNLLLERGVRIDLQDQYGRSPLHYAAFRGNASVVALLLEHGARTDLQDYDGQTPLSFGQRSSHYEVVRLLEQNQAA